MDTGDARNSHQIETRYFPNRHTTDLFLTLQPGSIRDTFKIPEKNHPIQQDTNEKVRIDSAASMGEAQGMKTVSSVRGTTH